MPRPKSAFDRLHPCDFYTAEELLEPGQMYTVYEIARLLQGLEPDAVLDEGVEEVLLDWAIPWVMRHSEDLVIAEPPTDDEPGYYGLEEAGDLDAGDADDEQTMTAPETADDADDAAGQDADDDA